MLGFKSHSPHPHLLLFSSVNLAHTHTHVFINLHEFSLPLFLLRSTLHTICEFSSIRSICTTFISFASPSWLFFYHGADNTAYIYFSAMMTVYTLRCQNNESKKKKKEIIIAACFSFGFFFCAFFHALVSTTLFSNHTHMDPSTTWIFSCGWCATERWCNIFFFFRLKKEM